MVFSAYRFHVVGRSMNSFTKETHDSGLSRNLKDFSSAKYLKGSFFEKNRKLRILNFCRELTECSCFVRSSGTVTVGTFRRNIHCIVFVMVCGSLNTG